MKTGITKLDTHLHELFGPLGEGPRRFLAFLFLNVISWQSILGTVLILHARALGIDSASVGVLNSLAFFASVLGIATKPLAERIGSKRLLMTGWTMRNILVAPLALSPWVYLRWGTSGAMLLLSATVGLFCITRALAGIAWSSWIHEIVPSESLARFYSIETIMTRLLGVTFGVICFFFLGSQPQLWRFSVIAACGVIAGLMSIRSIARVPGGQPPAMTSGTAWHHGFGIALRDRIFARFLGCMMLCTFVMAGEALLLTLLLRDRVGLGAGTILLFMSMGSLVTVFTTLRWRRIADTHSSPTSIAAATLLMSFCLLAMIPLCFGFEARGYAIALCLLVAVAETGTYVSSTRAYMLRMNPNYRHAYNALWAAALAVAGGISSLLVGWSIHWGTSTPFAIVAMGYALLMLATTFCFLRLPEGTVTCKTLSTHLFNPHRPIRSLARIWGYVLRPGPSVDHRVSGASQPVAPDAPNDP